MFFALSVFRPARWHKAKKVQLTPGQTEVKIDLPLPIVASNLMIEFSDFYENYQASTETLQCPRCSASVPANPGVCGNCGENVYQCHKCRWAAGFLCTSWKRRRNDWRHWSWCFFFFYQVYQLRWKRPLPVQRLWFLQIRQIWLHAVCKTMLCCGSHWEWGRQEKSKQSLVDKDMKVKRSSQVKQFNLHAKKLCPHFWKVDEWNSFWLNHFYSLHLWLQHNFCFSLQAVTNINTLLDKADRVYHQLMGHRPQLESLLSKVNEAAPEKPQVSTLDLSTSHVKEWHEFIIVVFCFILNVDLRQWNRKFKKSFIAWCNFLLFPVLAPGWHRSRCRSRYVVCQCEQIYSTAGSRVQRRLQDIIWRTLQDYTG